jgi:hypothetical protein
LAKLKYGFQLIQVPDAELNLFDLIVGDHSSHFFKVTLMVEVEAAGHLGPPEYDMTNARSPRQNPPTTARQFSFPGLCFYW